MFNFCLLFIIPGQQPAGLRPRLPGRVGVPLPLLPLPGPAHRLRLQLQDVPPRPLDPARRHQQLPQQQRPDRQRRLQDRDLLRKPVLK